MSKYQKALDKLTFGMENNYDDMTNYVRGDNYFYKSMVDKFGEDAVKEQIEKENK